MNYKEQRKSYLAALYARLSVDDMQDGTSVSIETQKKILEDYCKANNIEIYDFYCDDGYTGTNFNRPDFQRLLRDAESKKFNMVIVKDLSRLGREYIGVGKYIEEYFPERNIRFVAIGDDYDSECRKGDLDFIVPMKNLFNQFYPAECSRKVRQAFKAKASRGEFIGSQAPYGFKKSPEDKHVLLIDETTAPVIVRIFTLIAYHGYGYTKIARLFSQEKIPTPYALQRRNANKPCDKDPYDWNLGTISAIVHNETYLGNLVSGKREILSFKNKKVIKKDKGDWIVVEGMFPQIISQQLWDDAHRRIQERKRSTQSDFCNIFAGLIRCDKCGKILGLSSKRDNNPYYCCETYKKKGKDRCTAHYTLYNDVYNTVLENLRSTVASIRAGQFDFDNQVAAQVMSEFQSGNSCQATIEELEKQIEKLNKRYEQMYQDRLDGVISLQRFKELVAGDEEKQERLQKELDALRAREAARENEFQSLQAFVEKVKQFGDITALDKVLLNTLIEKIVIGERQLVDGEYTQEITIYYKFDNKFQKAS